MADETGFDAAEEAAKANPPKESAPVETPEQEVAKTLDEDENPHEELEELAGGDEKESVDQKAREKRPILGEDMQVYHGTHKDFEGLPQDMPEEQREHLKSPGGAYYTTDPAEASRYAAGSDFQTESGARVIPVVLSKDATVIKLEPSPELNEFIANLPKEYQETLRDAETNNTYKIDSKYKIGFLLNNHIPEEILHETAKKMGYDIIELDSNREFGIAKAFAVMNPSDPKVVRPLWTEDEFPSEKAEQVDQAA